MLVLASEVQGTRKTVISPRRVLVEYLDSLKRGFQARSMATGISDTLQTFEDRQSASFVKQKWPFDLIRDVGNLHSHDCPRFLLSIK